MEILNSNNNEIQPNKLYDLIEASYKNNNEADRLGRKHDLQINHRLSGNEHKVYVDKENNPTIVFTGSNKANDWLQTNPMIALGLQRKSKRFQDADKLVEEVKKKYNGKLTTVGHSLGGRLAEHVNSDKIYTVNKGTGLGDIGRTIQKNQTDIRTINDPFSILSKTQNHKNKLIEINNNSNNLIDAHKYSHLKKLSNYNL